MPSSKHIVELDVPYDKVWAFIEDLQNWAPLMPGYIAHRIVNEQEATWEFLGDFGFMKKKVSLKIERIIRVEPSMVTFDLEGLQDNIDGSGYFEIQAGNEGNARLIGQLDISAGGFMGAMVNNVLKTFVPDTTAQLVEAIKSELQSGVAS